MYATSELLLKLSPDIHADAQPAYYPTDLMSDQITIRERERDALCDVADRSRSGFKLSAN